MKDLKEKNIEKLNDESTDNTCENAQEKTQKEVKKNNTPFVFQKLENVDVDQGLTSEEAQNRILNHYNNENNVKTTKTTWQIIRGNLFTFFNMLYAVITVLLCFAKSWSNLTYLVIIIPNILLGIIQEIKAKKIIEKLNLVTAPHAIVIRDGEQIEVETKEVVLDDIIKFSTGNQIIADSIVKKGFVEVNESMITGEPDAILKKEGDMLFSGSFVVSGSCLAQVEHVGKDNYIEKLAIEAKKQKDNKSELLRTLNWIIRIVGIIIVPIAVFKFYQDWSSTTDDVLIQHFVELFKKTLDITDEAEIAKLVTEYKASLVVAGFTDYDKFAYVIPKVAGSVIGMIPSGLFLLTTMALSTGVYRLAKRNRTTVQQLYCIEMLARVDILCLDKTGTITDGTMRVIDCLELKNSTDYTMREIVGSMMNAFEETNATSEALIRFFNVNEVLKAQRIIPFSSSRKYSAVVFRDAGTFYLGAPEFVYPNMTQAIQSKVERYASHGCRVLLLTHTTSNIKGDELAKNVKPVGLIAIQDHIRDDAFETIEYFRNNGVDIKVISGDNPITVAEIASRAGIPNTNRYVSLEGLTEEEVKEIAFDYTIFGRVNPNQKKALVDAYKDKKKTVAMTGDGVNDILALKEADCSIAMASGSEATRNVANIVLMDSNFSAMPSVVAEGRRVINNIQRSSTLFLVKTIFTVLLTLFCMCMNIPYFFDSSQLLIIEFCIIAIPATVISLLPNNEKVQGRFIANVLKTSLPGALTILFFNMALYIVGLKITEFGWFVDGIRTPLFITVSLITTTAVTLTVLYKMCKPFNLVKVSVFIGVLILVIVVFYIGLYYPETFIGRQLDKFLKLDWPIAKNQKSTELINALVLMLMVLLVNPVMTLMENLLGTIKKVKI